VDELRNASNKISTTLQPQEEENASLLAQQISDNTASFENQLKKLSDATKLGGTNRK
jgi:hypothetical protein